ncbi:hypothetical protein BOC59_02805 [Burkholderia pseudomallei]|nr:hypothetical protein BOC59_02805 [Burkholderia pseudomallei]
MTRLTDRHKTIPYFKSVLVSSDTWGRSTRFIRQRTKMMQQWADLLDELKAGTYSPVDESVFDE